MRAAIAALLIFAGPAFAMTPDEMCAVIRRDIERYRAISRPCACPYNLMRNGATCNGRSAWSKPSGERPHCYFGDFDGTYKPLLRGDPARNFSPPPPPCAVSS